MEAYKHSVKYYETDKMGITHHSNYVRWMEEARVDFLEKLGWPYEKLEEVGIISPVIDIHCKYLVTTKFPEEISISVKVKEFKGVKLIINYEMSNAKGQLVCTGESMHCFVDENGRPLRLARDYSEFYEALMNAIEE